MSKEEQYARQAEEWTEREYADAHGVPRAPSRPHRLARAARSSPGDEVLDLACGDGGLGELLLERGLRYRGVDSTPEMVEAARRRLGDRAAVDARRPERLRASGAGRRDDGLPRDLLRARPRRVLRARRRVHAEEARLRPQPAAVPRRRRPRRPPCRGPRARSTFARSSCRRPSRCPAPSLALAKALERTGPPARLALRFRFTYLVAR